MGKTVFLIGCPLKHSVSSLFQQAAFDHHHLDIRYENRETNQAGLEAVIRGLRDPSVLGCNVTIPHKERVLSLLDEADDLAARIGAVNTVVNRDGRLLGFNTDAPGFVRALRQKAGFDSSGATAVVLGAGGAARAVGFALLQEGAKRLLIVNRSPQRAEGLAALLRGQRGHSAEVVSATWDSLRSGVALRGCHLVVNCTSLGMKHSTTEGESPLDAEAIPQGVLVCDLVYNPEETSLLRQARGAGAAVLGGLPMLVYQGAASFRLWTGIEAPLDIMFRKAREALGEDADAAA